VPVINLRLEFIAPREQCPVAWHKIVQQAGKILPKFSAILPKRSQNLVLDKVAQLRIDHQPCVIQFSCHLPRHMLRQPPE
jgi:hypothetical protein